MKIENEKIRILHVGSYPLEKCGISDYTKELISALNKTDIFDNEYYTIFFSRRVFLTALDYIYLFYKLVKKQYDYIHFQYTPVILGPYVVFLWLYKILSKGKSKIVITVHEKPTVYLKHLPVFLHSFYRIYEKSFLKVGDIIIVHTVEHKQILIKFYSLKNIFVIPLGIPELKYPSKAEMIKYRKKYHLNQYQYIIGFLGFIRPNKGVDLLINAFNSLPDTIKNNSILRIAGSFPSVYKEFKKELQQKVKTYNVENQVQFLGYLPKKDLPLFIKTLNILVLPYKENTQSSVVHTTISIGAPLILSFAGGFKEFIEKYKVALGTDLRVNAICQKIEYILLNPKIAERLLYRQKKIKKVLSWEYIVKNFYIKDIYKNVEN